MGLDKEKSLSAAAELRRRAEERLITEAPEARPPRTEDEAQRLLHELQVHQIELEIQNAELRQSRDEMETALGKYTDLYDFAPVGYFTLDRDGTIRAANLTGSGLLGIERSRLIGRRFGLFVADDTRPVFAEFLGTVLASQGKESCKATLMTEGNSLLFVHIEAIACGSGAECRIVVIDITEQKRAEEESRRSESIYRAIGESLDYGIWICAPDGRNIYASDSFLHLVGMTQEQCANFGWGEVLHPDDAERTIAAWKKCVHDGGIWDIEHRFRGVDGQWHPILARGVPVRDDQGTITCWAGINLDISRIKEAEKKLRESEERLRLALSAAHLAAWDWNVSSGTAVWNDELYRLMGYVPGQVTPGHRALVERLHPDDLAATEAMIRKCMAERSDFTAEFRTLWPDGTVRWLEARGEFEYDEAGQPLRSYGVMIDRTDRNLAEDALRQAHNELAAANVELEAFNYSVSHDLRRPLSVINSYCQVVLELCSDQLDEQSKGYIREMYEGTLRMNRLIDTLLKFSLVTRAEMRRETVDLSNMAMEIAVGLKVTEPERRVTFRIAEGVTVDGDAGLLQLALGNLIDNAWKYTGNQEETVIEFGVTKVAGKAACFVRDNGPGFDKVHADKLFVPFQRLPGTVVEGHGIGLATVERIVRRHGGRVWAECEPGQGATFLFTLE